MIFLWKIARPQHVACYTLAFLASRLFLFFSVSLLWHFPWPLHLHLFASSPTSSKIEQVFLYIFPCLLVICTRDAVAAITFFVFFHKYLLKGLKYVNQQQVKRLTVSRRSCARYGLPISSHLQKETAKLMKTALGVSVMFDEASDIAMNKRLNVFVNGSLPNLNENTFLCNHVNLHLLQCISFC